MLFTEQLVQALAVVGHTPAGPQTSGTVYVSSPVDMAVFRRAIALVDMGAMNSATASGTSTTGTTPIGTVVLQWFAANNVQFTTTGTATSGAPSNTTTAAATATLIVGSTGATRVEKFEIRADQLPAGTRWAQLQISVSSASVPIFGVVILGALAGYSPGNQFEATAFASGTTGSQIVDQAVVV